MPGRALDGGCITELVGGGAVDVGSEPEQLGGRRSGQPVQKIAANLERDARASCGRRGDGELHFQIIAPVEAFHRKLRLLVGLTASWMQTERVFGEIHNAIAIRISGGSADRQVCDAVRSPKQRAPGVETQQRRAAAGKAAWDS